MRLFRPLGLVLPLALALLPPSSRGAPLVREESNLRGEPPAAPYELLRCSGSASPGGKAQINATVLKDAGGAGRDGYLAVIDNPIGNFHVEGHCDELQKTSFVASALGCRYAINGGPFNSFVSGGCIGPTISNGNVLNTDWQTSYASFGLSAGGEWVVGHISQDTAAELNLTQAVTGLGEWLVRGGRAVPAAAAAGADALAGRSGVGVDSSGRLMLLQVDGCEHCPFSGGSSGLTLAGFAHLFAEQGALHAINLDGGGSSVSVAKGEVINHPTGLDIELAYERPVASILCVAADHPDADVLATRPLSVAALGATAALGAGVASQKQFAMIELTS